VLGQPTLEVDRAAGVERTVGALDEVGPGHAATLLGVEPPGSPRAVWV
jgi:hypothetical protein